ncbi:M48 family metallopeptidase [Tunicatimonas pelagia]|uniref:M48 family metallopeptidase n=1 Tax=Tunicatimonas pelagia TaxID=931531 RepID=UPI0026661F91|nr:M48 family metallopeptidase [Tunicatimonas pelagia]WKN45576.1 M48 family metallopeptidase [Tunicatimonas pelagia]
MTNKIEAKYFDGQSSASQQTIVAFDETMNEFRLHFAAGTSFVWNLNDLRFEQYGHLLEIRNKNYSGALLKIDDKNFSQSFYVAIKENKGVDIHTRLLKLGFSKILAIAVCLLGLVMLAYFYVLPPVAEKSAALLPNSFDDQIGNMFMETFLDHNTVDSAKTKYLRQFASELNLKNEKPLQFFVVESNEVNAFALPNGQIVIFTAILENMQSAGELAALLGHEVSHINHRHSIKMLCRSLAGYLTVSLLLSDVNGVVTVLAENAQQLHSLSYSRQFEQEADEQGLKILMDNNIDPNGMVQLFDQLEEESEYAVPKIISSHPLTKDRKENMRRIIYETVYEVKPHNKLNSLFEKIKR